MLNLGALQWTMGIDTRALDAARNRVESFGRMVKQTQDSANRGFETNIAQVRKQENAVLSSLQAMKNAQDAVMRSNADATTKQKAVEDIGRAYNNLTKAIADTGKTADATKFDRNLSAFNQSIQTTQNNVRNMAQTQKELRAQIDATAAAAEREANALARAQQRVLNFNAGVDRSSRIPDARKTSLTDRADLAFSNFQSAGASSAALRQFNAELGSLQRQAKDMSALSGVRSAIQGIGSAAMLMDGHLGGLAVRMFALSQITRDFGMTAGVAAGSVTVLALGLGSLVKGAIETTLTMQRMEQSMLVATGNTYAAANAIKFVHDVAVQTGGDFASMGQSFGKFATSSILAGQSMAETEKQFQAISVATGKLHLSAESTEQVFLALEQMLAKGTVQSEELKKQLGNQLPGAFEIGARAMGYTAGQMRGFIDALKEGKVASAEFLPKFVEQLQKDYHFKATDEINTLQAALGRAQTAITDFLIEFERTFQIGNAAKVVVEGFTKALNFLTSNMNTLAGVLGALAGAFVGLTVAMAINAVISYIQSIGGLANIFLALRVALINATAAFAALDAVLLANPIGAVITLIVVLIGVLGGAYIGYDQLTKAIGLNNGAMAQTKAIEDYIKLQKELGFQIRQTTNDYLAQARAMAQGSQNDALNAFADMVKDRVAGPSTMDNFKAIMASSAGMPTTGQEIFNERMTEQEANYKRLREKADRDQALVTGLTQVGTLPEIPSLAGHPGGTDLGGDKAKKIEYSIEAVKRLAIEAKEADTVMRQLMNPGTDFDLADDLSKAEQIMRQLTSDPKKADRQLQMAADYLGVSVKDLLPTITAMETRIRQTQDATNEFKKTVLDVRKIQNDMNNTAQYNTFLEQGGDPSKRYQYEAMTKAQNALQKLQEQADKGSPAAIKALGSIQAWLVGMGYSADSAQQALARMFATLSAGEQYTKVLEQINEDIKQLNHTIADQQVLIQAFGVNATVGEAAERFLKLRDAARQYEEALRALGKTQEEIAAIMKEWWAKQMQADAQAQQLEKIKQRAQELRDVYKSFGRDATSAIMSVVKGTKSLGEAIEDFFMGIADKLLENALNNLFDDLIDGLLGKGGGADQTALGMIFGGGDGSQASAQQQLAASARDAALALQQLTIAAGGQTGAGGGLLSAVGGLLGGGSSGGGGGIFSTILGGLGGIFGRASGGNGLAGNMYRVNETGTLGDIFVPRSNGQFHAVSDLLKAGGGKTTQIDASTYIDARGATQDMIPVLRDELRQSEDRIMKRLPYMIDGRVMDSKLRLRNADA